ncbi:MAG: rhamnulokinase [Lachnospiraceae bacterium]|nr:rhamnulokinase [Lachnospiraceae bacterium]
MSSRRMLAIDLGASSGRGIIGQWDGKKITLEEIHRFSNDPVMMPGGFFWDTVRLLFEIKAAVLKASHGGGAESLGIDTWGVDYGFIDRSGALLSNPYHYRDSRTADIQPWFYGNMISKSDLYRRTGIQAMSINSIFQLAADRRDRPWVLENAESMLFTPDLLGYLLTGQKQTEYTIASTSSILDARKRDYAWDVIDKMGLPRKMFRDIVQPGFNMGRLLPSVDEETGSTGAEVIKVGSHDTASAVLSVPAKDTDFLYISSGTWSLMGTESREPVLTPLSEKYDFTNEGGVGGTIRVLRNIMGLWIEQESRRQWTREGTKYTFDELSEQALASKPLQSLINPDDPVFSTAGNMPKRICEYCGKTGQHVPENVGEIVRCIFDSLALKYRWTAEKLEEMTGKTYSAINIVGGGTKEEMLSQFTADATHKHVFAGPVEATAIGNIAVQCMSRGEISGIPEAREAVRNSFEIREYEPSSITAAQWDEAYGRFIQML